jgi:hypothetical protein
MDVNQGKTKMILEEMKANQEQMIVKRNAWLVGTDGCPEDTGDNKEKV